MIDAGPSLRAAEGLSGAQLLTYLVARGWTARPSRVEGVSILSKRIAGADRPAEFILPVVPGSDDEQRRVADALRTVAAVEETTVEKIADEARQGGSTAARSESLPQRVTVRAWKELDVREFEEELHRLLGIKGSMGSLVEGRMSLIYQLPNGEQLLLNAPETLTAEQRSAIIQDVSKRLAANSTERWRYEVVIQELQTTV